MRSVGQSLGRSENNQGARALEVSMEIAELRLFGLELSLHLGVNFRPTGAFG